MNTNSRKLIIEALSFDYGRAFGFQEYLFNLLDYFYNHSSEFTYDKLYIICKLDDERFFKKYTHVFTIKSYKVKNFLHKYFILNTFSYDLKLTRNDCILFTNNYSSLIKRCKHALVIHDLLYLRKEYMPNKLFRIQRSIFIPRSIYLADKVVGITKWVANDIVTQFNIKQSNKVIHIYNYFNFGKYKGGDVSSKIKDYCNNNSFFLVVSANAKHKNLNKVIDAFELFCNKENNTQLLFVGKISGYIKERYDILPMNIQQRISNFYNISNYDLGYLYCHAKAFISATLFEGLGMPIVESLYFNTPTIVSNINVIKEVTLGKANYFPPMDHILLSQLMLRENGNRRQETKELMENMYSENNTVAKYIKTLNEL